MDLKKLSIIWRNFNIWWQVIIYLTSRIQYCFLNWLEFAEDKCKLWLKRVFKSWISELDWNRPLFLLTKTSKENMYWDGSESICNRLNSWRHESWLPVFVMILTLFLNFKTAVARMWINPKNNTVWHDWMYIRKIDCSQYTHRQKKVLLS